MSTNTNVQIQTNAGPQVSDENITKSVNTLRNNCIKLALVNIKEETNELLK